jgi:hypothetical protein
MVLILNALIVFDKTDKRPKIELREIARVSIEKSLLSFTDTATIEVAGSLYYKGKNTPIEKLVSAGDPLTIYLGYGQELKEEFTGFVKQVSPQNPIKIECEDYSYLLKNKVIEKAISIKQGTFKELLKKILPAGMEFESVDAKIVNYVTPTKTVAQILDDLKKDYGFVSNFKGKKLYVGQIYFSNQSLAPTAVYRFGQNVKKDNLTYENREQNPLVIVRSKIKGQKKPLEAKKGQPGGKENIVKLSNITDLKVLQGIADRRYELLTQKVVKGNISGFGEPVIQPGDIFRLDNARFDGMNGKSFYADTVKQEFGPNGWERNVEPGKMLAS